MIPSGQSDHEPSLGVCLQDIQVVQRMDVVLSGTQAPVTHPRDATAGHSAEVATDIADLSKPHYSIFHSSSSHLVLNWRWRCRSFRLSIAFDCLFSPGADSLIPVRLRPRFD